MSWLLDDAPLTSILLTRLRYLGDIVMSTVLVRALKEGDPELARPERSARYRREVWRR